ncbi:vWA domain-containing protein [Paractinoplanes rishiriensis]|uniref:VWA domain-containing protein n=1 Tax=Paractinoplanes rishiriensis TaxID=1050105 RepID=A0A919K2J3_9ACTN|nr:vWA domain-containing protein [Actinoplanes rishiriensis]GIE97654.1 VWA domain-containing protein [Actinoplanes rishiriensis]
MSELISIAATEDKREFLAAASNMVHRGRPNPPYEFRYYSDTDVMRFVAGRDFRIFCPSSVFSLAELEQHLDLYRRADDDREVGLVPFAASPVVLLMRPEIYTEIRAHGPIGWRTLLSSDWLRLMHAHSHSADGLAVLAAMATAAGGSPEIDHDEFESGRSDEFIEALQRQVMEYAPNDVGVVERGMPDGEWRADVLALQEHSAIAAVSRHPDLPAVLVHPDDGTAWVHSVLGRTGSQRPGEDEAFAELAAALVDPAMNQVYLSRAVRPMAGQAPASSAQVIGSPAQPAPHLPARRLMRTLRKRGARLKRSADVCLVVDTSGSMAGNRLSAAKQGLTAFLDSLEGQTANAGVIFSADQVNLRVPLQPVESSRAAVPSVLGRLLAGGSTALLDAVNAALDVLDGRPDPANLRAVVALTDGEENGSSCTVAEVERRLGDTDVLFFGIAYGGDAGRGVLERLAQACGGHSLVTDERGIQAAYQLLSQHL